MLADEFPTATTHDYGDYDLDVDGHQCKNCGHVAKRRPGKAGKCAGVPVYTAWSDIPEGILTETSIKNAGKKLASGQQPVAAKKNIDRRGRWAGHYYALYALDDAIERAKATPAQLEALKKARYMGTSVPYYCCKCGDGIGWATRKKIQEKKLDESICHICVDKQDVINDIQCALQRDIIILDTETTGLNDAHAIEIAIINGKGETLFNSRIHTEIEIHPRAYAVHGISNDDLKDAPKFADVFDEIAGIINGAEVWIYNSSFDMPILHDMARLIDRKLKPKKVHCAMEAYATFVGDYSYHFETYRWQPLPSGDQTALGDCVATLDVMKKIAGGES